MSYHLGSKVIYSEVILSDLKAWAFTASALTSLILFLICWLKDPGFVYRDPSIEFLQLLELFDPNSLCPECEVIRVPRSRHCNICNRCVSRYDHHCPWINNCVGSRNHGWFFAYTLASFLYSLATLTLSVDAVLHLADYTDSFKSIFDNYENGFYPLTWSLSVAIYLFLGAVSCFFTFSLLYASLLTNCRVLLLVHMKNFCLNQTTSERYSRSQTKPKVEDKQQPNIIILNSSENSSGKT
jgi:palmitoyltransferase